MVRFDVNGDQIPPHFLDFSSALHDALRRELETLSGKPATFKTCSIIRGGETPSKTISPQNTWPASTAPSGVERRGQTNSERIKNLI